MIIVFFVVNSLICRLLVFGNVDNGSLKEHLNGNIQAELLGRMAAL